MIVVDTNVIHYCWVRGQHTAQAQAVLDRDADWHAPLLWRSEMRNILCAYLRRGLLARAQADGILQRAEDVLFERSHAVDHAVVMDVVEMGALTAYDAEFVALAEVLDVPLVTADRQMLRAFPGRACTMEAFVSG